MTVKNVAKKPTAREKLTPSRLKETQLEMMGADVDLKKFYAALSHKDINIIEAVTSVDIERTIQGSSTVTVVVADHDRVLLQSGLLSSALTIEIDGLFFVLYQVQKGEDDQDGILTLTFEDREVHILRTYTKPIKQSISTSRLTITRAAFILRLIQEVKEERIPYNIPELSKVQPIAGQAQVPTDAERTANRSLGIPKGIVLRVKTGTMSESQRRVANALLDTCAGMLLSRKYFVMIIMAAIQESTLTNLGQPSPGDYNYLSSDPTHNPVGVLQQIAFDGWPASQDVPTDAKAFLDALVKQVQANPSQPYYQLIEDVQRSGNASAYAAWRTDADRIVTAYGMTSGTSADANSATDYQLNTTGDYEFYRGQPPVDTGKAHGWKPESSWDCIQRLANEVRAEAFFVSGTFYYISDDDLIKSQPVITCDESTHGILSIGNGTYSELSKIASIDILCEMGRWSAPPGSVVVLQNMGPWNGRWIVNDVTRSAFDPHGTITLKKRQPLLPEPAGSNINQQNQGATTWTGAPAPAPTPSQRQYRAVGLVQPIPKGMSNNGGNSAVHETLGLDGYPASDFFAQAGTPVLAVENGKIVRFSGHDPSISPLQLLGPHGPFAWSIYLLGDSGTEYYYTHLGTRTCRVGQTVSSGEVIATVANYALYGTPSHTHLGVHPGSTGNPDIYDIMNAPQAVK